MFDTSERFSVDLGRHVGDVDEVDVCDVIRCAAPPPAARHMVAVDENIQRSDVLVYTEEAEVLEERHVRRPVIAVRSQHDVVDNVRYHETLGIN